MRKAGCSRTNPGNPQLLALLDAGASIAEFIGAASDAVRDRRDEPFAYALKALTNQRIRAADDSKRMHRGELQPDKSLTVPSDASKRTAAYLAEQSEQTARATPPPAALAEVRQRIAERKLG